MSKTHATRNPIKNIAHVSGSLALCRRYVSLKNLRSNREEVTCEKCLAEMVKS